MSPQTVETQTLPRTDLIRFHHYIESLLGDFLNSSVEDAQAHLGISDQEAYEVLKSLLDQHFQSRQ